MYPLAPPRLPSQWRYGIPSASSRRRPLSPFLGFVIRPIGLTVLIRLIPPTHYLILTYSGLILHLWILILRATHRSQQGVVTPGRVPTQLVAVCRASPAGRCRATFRRLPSALLLDLLVLLSLLDLSPPYQLSYPHLFRTYPTPMDTYTPSYPPHPAGCSHSKQSATQLVALCRVPLLAECHPAGRCIVTFPPPFPRPCY